ncbi:MAG TPA: hypothetical protein VEB42_12815, partial [Chitinophagaceae bacterium]|nr:hypothetical protein [Chitinophagaceae bacterium]
MELFPRNIPDAQARIWVHHNSDDLQRRLNRAIHPARNVKSNSSLEGLLLEIGNLFDRPMLVDQLGGQ